jgi:DNA polymerase III subunit gamma/tau
LSLLDQLLAFGGGSASESSARAMLGTVDREHAQKLAGLLADGDLTALMQYAESLEQWSPDYEQLLQQMASLFERIALQQAISDYQGDELHDPELLRALAARTGAGDLQLFYQAAIVGRRDLPLAPDPRAGFRMTLLRMLAFRPAGAVNVAIPAAAVVRAAAAPAAGDSQAWVDIVATLELQGAARQLAANCVLLERSGAVVRLALDPRSSLVHTPAQEEKLSQALSRHYGSTVRVIIERRASEAESPARERERVTQQIHADARAAFAADPTVRSLQEQFSASIHPESVRPLKPV